MPGPSRYWSPPTACCDGGARETGGLAESERAYREQLAILEAVLPPGHVNIAGALIGLGGILTDRGKAGEAEPMLRRALAMRIEKLGPGDRRVARAQRALGLSLAAQGRHAEAEKPLLQSYRTLGSADNWFHRTLREQTRLDLVAFYRSWGKRAEAAKYLAGTPAP